LAEVESQLFLSRLGLLDGWTPFVESILVPDSGIMLKNMICFMRLAYEKKLLRTENIQTSILGGEN
jgi:hypothetical protein